MIVVPADNWPSGGVFNIRDLVIMMIVRMIMILGMGIIMLMIMILGMATS